MNLIQDKISKEFLVYWSKKYKEHDEEECCALKKQLPKEIKDGKLSKKTLLA